MAERIRVMELVAARHILEALADGLDPATGELLDPGSPVKSPDVVRALHVALSAIDHRIRRQDREAELPSNAGRPWHQEDDQALAEAFDAGYSVAAIAQRFARTEGSIASRLVRIGKVPDRDTARVANRQPRGRVGL